MNYTLRQFIGSLQEIPVVLRMEIGGDGGEEKPLTGDLGFAIARQLLPKGTGRR